MKLYDFMHKYADRVRKAMEGKGVDALDIYMGEKEAYLLMPLIFSMPIFEILQGGKKHVEDLIEIEDVIGGNYPNPCEMHASKAKASAVSWFPINGFAIHSNGGLYPNNSIISPENLDPVMREISEIFGELTEEYNKFMSKHKKEDGDGESAVIKAFPG